MNADDAFRKKQLGQYFTGVRVARLLAALAYAENAKTVIDPMVGTGDMLQACLEVGAQPDELVGIDLDPLAIDRARTRFVSLPNATLMCGDAFAGSLPAHQFDLVITNPPYIRYQSRTDAIGMDVPAGDEIRRNLIRAIDERTDMSAAARHLFGETARAYPGTADVAVPAWTLCAALVAEGGMLAVVVPQAWLSRNYAQPIRAMLDGAFEVQYLVEDGDASWFDDAQVRTHLLVARRRPVDGNRTGRGSVVLARATSELARGGYLTGDLPSEHDVALALRAVSSTHATTVTTGLTARVETRQDTEAHVRLAPQLVSALAVTDAGLPERTLASYGWQCGQGMRTGANDFFYVTRTSSGVVTAARWTHRYITPLDDVLVPTVRRQSDLSDRLHVDPCALTTVLLNLRGWATSDDRESAISRGFNADWWDQRYSTLPDDLTAWIHEVANVPLSARDPDKRFPDLTAVAPNIKTGRAGEPLGYWYQLPALAARHQPELLLPRVCGARPRAYMNPGRAVVDANFSTLWPTTPSAMPTPAMFALLNSTWVWANLEQNCNVLGGGALKVEANDLRRVPLPDLHDLGIADLTRLGKALITTADVGVLIEVDWVIARAIARDTDPDELTQHLVELAQRGVNHRSHS